MNLLSFKSMWYLTARRGISKSSNIHCWRLLSLRLKGNCSQPTCKSTTTSPSTLKTFKTITITSKASFSKMCLGETIIHSSWTLSTTNTLTWVKNKWSINQKCTYESNKDSRNFDLFVHILALFRFSAWVNTICDRNKAQGN